MPELNPDSSTSSDISPKKRKPKRSQCRVCRLNLFLQTEIYRYYSKSFNYAATSRWLKDFTNGEQDISAETISTHLRKHFTPPKSEKTNPPKIEKKSSNESNSNDSSVDLSSLQLLDGEEMLIEPIVQQQLLYKANLERLVRELKREKTEKQNSPLTGKMLAECRLQLKQLHEFTKGSRTLDELKASNKYQELLNELKAAMKDPKKRSDFVKAITSELDDIEDEGK